MTPTIPEAAVNAAVEAVDGGVNWVAGLFGENYDSAEEVMRDALTAALPFLTGVTVKKLEWKQEDNGDVIAESFVGWYHIGLPYRTWNLTTPQGQALSFHDLNEAKAAAQADYEARFWSMAEVSGNTGQLEAVARIKDARNAIEELANTHMCLTLEDWSRISSTILSAIEIPTTSKMEAVAPSQRAQALEEGDLNARLKAKGMYTIDEMMGTLPVDKWRVHTGMTDLKFFGEWLERKTREYLTMKAAYDAGNKDESDELYEWVLAHYAAFHDVLVNFRAALSHPVSPDMGVERPVEGGWLPIETAPNNKAILVHYDDGNIELISADDNEYSWIAYTVKEDFCTKPTHWRPLPQAPGVAV